MFLLLGLHGFSTTAYESQTAVRKMMVLFNLIIITNKPNNEFLLLRSTVYQATALELLSLPATQKPVIQYSCYMMNM